MTQTTEAGYGKIVEFASPVSDDDRSGLCHNCGSHVGRGECTNATCPLGHRDYPPTTPDDRIPCLSPPGNDAGSLRAAMLARVAEITKDAFRAADMQVPLISNPRDWLAAGPESRLASLLLLAEAWLVDNWAQHDPDELKQASAAISGALDWSAEASQPSHATLAQRRTQPLYQRRCDTFGCREILRFDQPPPPDVMIFGCEKHGGNVHGPPGWRDGP